MEQCEDGVAQDAAPSASAQRAGKSLRHKAMDLLARREHTQAELCQKLTAKGHEAEAVAEVVAQLCDEGLVSDERFTEAFIRYRMERGYGPMRIQSELRERGVDDKIQAAYLDFRDPRWREQTAQVRRKRFGDAPPQDYKERARQSRFLQYRGFTSDQIRQALEDDEFA